MYTYKYIYIYMHIHPFSKKSQLKNIYKMYISFPLSSKIVFIYIYIYIYIYIFINVYIYIYIYIYILCANIFLRSQHPDEFRC